MTSRSLPDTYLAIDVYPSYGAIRPIIVSRSGDYDPQLLALYMIPEVRNPDGAESSNV